MSTLHTAAHTIVSTSADYVPTYSMYTWQLLNPIFAGLVLRCTFFGCQAGQEPISTPNWPDNPPLLQCFKISLWLTLHFLERNIKSQAWSNTWQEHQPILLLAQHHVFHLSLNWLPHICSHKEASELKHGDDSLMDRLKPRKQSGNEPLFCIRSSNFFRCSSSLTSHMRWDMLSHAESVEEKPNTERNSRNGTYGANFRMVRNKLQNYDSWPIRFGHFDARRHLPSVSKQKDRRFKWFHVPMQNLQSCSRKTGVCLQILGMFSALQALEILHSWLGNAQVASSHSKKCVFSCFLCLLLAWGFLTRVIHSSPYPDLRRQGLQSSGVLFLFFLAHALARISNENRKTSCESNPLLGPTNLSTFVRVYFSSAGAKQNSWISFLKRLHIWALLDVLIVTPALLSMSVSENRVDPSHEWLHEAYSAFLERNHWRVCRFHSFKSHGFASRGPLLHRFQITLILAPQFLQRHSSTISCGSGNETHVASLDKSHERYMFCSISDVYFILHTKLRLLTLSQCKRNMHMMYTIYTYIYTY